MRIGELASELSVSTKTLRHYEKIGLLPPAIRAENGYRYFSSASVRRAKIVVACRRMELSLNAIKELLDSEPSELRPQLIRILDEKRRDMSLEIAILQGKMEDMDARHLGLALTPIERPSNCICAFLGEDCTCTPSQD